MTGFEIVGVVLGVLPVVVEIVQAYQKTSNAVQTIRKAPAAIQRVRSMLLVQKKRFTTEIHLLLRLIDLKEVDLQLMLKDPAHKFWHDEALNTRFNDLLKDNYEACEAIVLGIRNVMEDVEKELARFKSATGKNLRTSISVALKESKLDEKLLELRRLNSDLTNLKVQISELHETQTSAELTKRKRKVRNHPFLTVQKASMELFDALTCFWCCEDSGKVQHYAKLCIDATIQEEPVTGDVVCLDLALSHQGERDAIPNPLMWFYVRCMTADRELGLETHANPLLSSSHQEARSLASFLAKQNIEVDERVAKSQKGTASVGTVNRSQAFTTRNYSTTSTVTTTFSSVAPPLIPTIPLRSVPASAASSTPATSFCQVLKQHENTICQLGPSRADHCLYALKTPTSVYKHVFYSGATRDTSCQRKPPPESQQLISQKQIISLEELVHRSTERSLPIADQLQIALKMSIAVMQYNSTPWLGEEWGLRNISFFGTCDEPFDDQGAVKTLHLSAKSSQKSLGGLPTPTINPEPPDAVRLPSDLHEFKSASGIRNMTMASLGLALLEIGYREPLRSHRKPFELHDVVTARRLAEGRPTPLGRRFQKLAQKCFQYDDYLDKAEFQEVVYQDVICELEGLIQALSVNP